MEYGDEEECEINRDEIESDEDEDANDECDERDINDNSLHEENPTEIDERYINGSDADEGDSEHYVNDSDEGNINNSSDEELGPHECDVSEEDSLIELFSEEYISSDEDILMTGNQCMLMRFLHKLMRKTPILTSIGKSWVRT